MGLCLFWLYSKKQGKIKYLFKLKFGIIRSWKPPTDIKQRHFVSQLRLVDNFHIRSNTVRHALNGFLVWLYGRKSLTPMSNTQRASVMACVYVSGSVQPLPTWKLTPITSNPSSFALSSSIRLLFNVAPNFTLSLHTAFESSVAIRRTSLQKKSLKWLSEKS